MRGSRGFGEGDKREFRIKERIRVRVSGREEDDGERGGGSRHGTSEERGALFKRKRRSFIGNWTGSVSFGSVRFM